MTVSRVVTLGLAFLLTLPAVAEGSVRLSSRSEPVVSARAPAATTSPRVLPARAAPFRFNMLGLHWRGSGEVWFRTSRAPGAWSVWRPARPEEEDGPNRGSRENRRGAQWKLGNPYWAGPADRIQYRLAGSVLGLRAHFLWSALRPAPEARRLSTAPSAPPVITRKQWGADESIVRGTPSYASRLAFSVVHHTAGAKPTSRAQSAAIVRGILAYHVRSNGWNDIGYNFLVDPFGQVFEGRAGGMTRNVIGAHAQGFNTGSVGAAFLGTYESSSVAAAARTALVSLLAWRLDLAHVDPASRLTWRSAGNPKFPAGTPVTLNAVSGHRDTGATSCPGSALYGTLGSIGRAAAAHGGAKIYDPRAQGALGGPLRFTARLSVSLPWTVKVLDAAGVTVAAGSGAGTAVDWTWDSRGAPAGRYTYAIEAGDARPARAGIGGAVALALTGLSASPAVVTPNGDGVTDTTQVRAAVTATSTLELRLETADGSRAATVVFPRPVAPGTTRITWRPGAGVVDGRYRLVAEASAGAERTRQAVDFVVDRTLGRLTLRPAAFSPNGDGRRDTLAADFDLTRQATVALRLRSGSRTVATLVSGHMRGGGRQTFTWDGRSGSARVPDGRYRIVVVATTPLGTRKLAGDVVLDRRAPRVDRVSAVRSRGGTLVRFRLSEPARVTLRLGGKTVRASRAAGTRSVWTGIAAPRVTVVAEDTAANVSRPVAVRVR